VFQSFQAGTIPIYYGSNNSPEPSVINRDAIVFWDYESNNETNVDLIKRLLNSDKTYLDFINQPRFLPEASDYIINKLDGLKEKFKEILL
jgi:hypothetical protein